MSTTAPLPAGDSAAPASDPKVEAVDTIEIDLPAASSGDETANATNPEDMPFDEDAAIAEMMANPESEPEAAPTPTPAKSEEAAAPAEEDVPESGTETESESGGKLAKNFRVAAKSDLDAQIMALYRRNPDMTLAEATARVSGQNAATPANPAAPAPNTDATNIPPPADTPTVEALEAKRVDLRRQLKEATTALDFEKAGDIQAELADLPYQIHALKEQERTAAASKQAEVQQAISTAEAKAIELYPDSAVEGSDLYNEIKELYADMEANGDPLIEKADCGLRITQMAAARLGIPPVKKGQANPPGKTAAAATNPEPVKAPENPVRPRPITGRGAASTGPPPDAEDKYLDSLSFDQLNDLAKTVFTR